MNDLFDVAFKVEVRVKEHTKVPYGGLNVSGKGAKAMKQQITFLGRTENKDFRF